MGKTWRWPRAAARSVQTTLRAVAALLAAIACCTSVDAQPARQQPATEWREPGRNPSLYPSSAQTFEIAELQLSLFINRCYGNQLKRDQVDGRVGPLTKRAIDVFVDEYRARFPGTRQPFATAQDVAEKARELAASTEDAKFCERSRLLPQYFSGSDEHVTWVQKHQKLYPQGQTAIWRMKTELLSNGCYGDVSDTTTHEFHEDFGAYSRRALHVFVDEYHLRNPTRPRLATSDDAIKAAEQTVIADLARGQPLAFCTQSTFMATYFPNPQQVFGDPDKCAFPRSADKWLATLGASNSSFRLGAAMKELDEAYKTYFDVVKEPDPVKAGNLGIYEAMKTARGRFFREMRSLRETRDKLARLGAVLNDATCYRCMLLADYDALLTIATPPSGGRRYLVAKSVAGTAPARAPGTPVSKTSAPPNSMDLAQLDFDLLSKSHQRIQSWREKQDTFEAKKQALASATDVRSIALEFAGAAKEAEDAKEAMLGALWTEWVSRPTPPTTDLVSDFAGQRDAKCSGDIHAGLASMK